MVRRYVLSNIFFEIYRCFTRLTGSSGGDIIILLPNICNDIAFQRSIPKVVPYEDPEKNNR